MLDLLISGETSSVERIASVRSSSAVRLTFSVVMLVACFGAARGGFAETPASEARLRNGAHTVSPRLAESYGKVPLSFEPNQGQTDGRVQFLSRGPGYGIFLTPGEAVLSFQGKDKAAGQSVLQMKLVGANAGATVEAQDKLPGTSNYMKGTDQSKWATEIPTYGKVRYAGVYPGVDLVFYGNQRQLEYDFVVAPEKDAGKIALEFTGATPVVDAAGDLVLGAEGGARFKRPVVYQMVGGERVAVAGAYEVRGQRVGFRLGKYDHSRELVIDPVVTYLTYLGGTSGAFITAVTVDSSGAAYVTGSTSSPDFPIRGAYESSFPSGATAMFVSKLDQSGTSLVYSTFLASNGYAEGYAIHVDGSGDAYVAGVTGDGFPVTSGAFQTICGGAHDANGNRVNGCEEAAGTGTFSTSGVLAKLSADGSSLVYATYLGGSNFTEINGVTVDQGGNAYVTGQTASYCGPGPYSASTTEPFECFPTTSGAIQSGTVLSSTPDGQGLIATYAFLTKFDATGSTLSYSSLLGQTASGSVSNVYGGAIAVTSQGVAFITGGTGFSPTNGAGNVYTTNGALQSTKSTNGISAFVAAFDTNAGSLLYSTYLGGRNAPFDEGYGIAADSAGNAYVAGYTYDCDFPTTSGAFETEAQYAPTDTANVGKCHTGFVAKLNPTGNALVWATYLGSTPLVTGTTAEMVSLALGSDNSVYVAGQVGGTGFPLVNPVLPQTNTTQVSTVTHLSADGGTALFSSTVGGSSQTPDYVSGIAVDASGAIYVAGATQDPHFPTTNNAVQPGFSGTAGANTYNGFIAKISPSTPPTPNNGLTGNLLANPGAELGSIADWTAGGGGTPTVDTGSYDPGISPHTGSYDFLGGSGNPTDSLSQTVSIIQQGITTDQVDGGTLFANVSFWEQGPNQGTPSDSGGVTLTFLDTDGATLGTATIGTEDSHDGTWANVTGLPAIPVGTRSITYTMNFIRNAGNNNDSFIDDNVLSVHTNTGLTIFPSSLHFGNVPVGQLSQTQTATVTNNQTTAITIDQIISELGANPSEFGVSTYCPQGQSLAAGASCPVTITFAPTGVGPKSAGIAIQTESVPPLQQVLVDGNGTGGILQVNPGNLKAIAGNGTAGYSGDGGAALAAQLRQPNGVAFDPSGNLYIADSPANVIRKVDTAGNITTFAGDGTGGFNGDGGPATQAELYDPFSVTSDKNGNIYIQDTGNYVIRKVDATTGLITTVAGTPGAPGRLGDGGPATAAKLNENQGARFDSAGNLYVALCPTGTVRKIDTTGIITTVAGNPGTPGFSGDGGQATAAQLQCPSGVAIDAAGNFYIADEFNQVIRKVNTAGVISTIAGTPGVAGYGGDGGAATAAKFTNPNDVAIDSLGNLYVADSGNNRVRKIDTNGIITTAAGGLDNAGSAAVNTPLAVTVDAANHVYFSDSGNGKIQEIFPQGTQPFPATVVGSTSAAQSLTLSNIGNTDVTLAPDGAFNLSGDSSDFALTPGACGGGTVLAANGGSCALSITFAPTAVGQRVLTVMISDDALNSPQSFSIGGTGTVAGLITPTITWAAPASILYGTALSSTQLNAVATGTGGVGVNGTYVYSPAAGAVLGVGEHPLSVTFTPTDAGYGAATGNTSITVTQFTPYLTWATPAPITTATPLSATQLNAVAKDINGAVVSGTYDYTPELGSLLAAGTQQITVTFTPDDTVDYLGPVSTTRSIVVTQASGGTATATITTLSVTSGGSAVTTVASGSVVTLTAAVVAGANSVSPAQVAFCDATATSCTGSHLLGIAQVTEAGTGIYKFVPGLGAHSYRAMFLGTKTYGASASTAAALAVTGTVPTTTTIAQNGTAGNYTLTGTVMGAPYPMQNATQSVTINLGQSAQIYVLTGTGGTAGNGGTYGNYYNTQGSCVTSGSTTTCDLTGPFTSSTAGYAAGTYDFQTVFTGPISSSVTSQTISPVGTNEPNLFDYSGFAPSTTMALKLNVTGGGAYTIPVVENGDFDPNLDDLSFDFTSTACGGTSLGSNPCQQDYVGTVAGATYSGPITGAVEFEMPSPPTLVGPTGTVSFLDTSNANASLGTGVLGAPTAGFSLAQAGPPLSLSQPFGGVSGDFNGDGLLDLAVLGNLSDQTQTLNIYLGNGDGTFTLHATYSVQTGAGVVQVADVNGDGIPDLVVPEANLSEGGSNAVFLGNGDGTFKPEVDYSAPEGFDLGLSDLNHDGLPDIVGLYPGGAQIYVQLNNGDGSFKAPVFYPSGNSPNGVAEADFDGDGNIDVAIANQSDGTVSVLLGKGDGTFQPQVTYAVGPAPASVRVGDFNEDGVVDLVVVNSGDGTIGILSGNGNGTFGAQKTYAVGSMPFQIAVADLNGDGHLDITISNSGSSTQGVVLGNGDGTFQTQVVYATAAPAALLGIGDFNGDGRPDVAVGTGVTSEITTLVSQVTETATATVAGVSPTAPGTHAVVASYPGDGHYGKSVSQATNLTTVTIAPVITWMPAVATIPYGTALGAQQLNATATSAGVAVPGTFVYTPAAGTVLTAGTQTLSVTFTPTSSSYSVATGTATITVTQATPVITWAAPAGIAYGTPLSATQLDATVAGVGTGALAGTLVYTPAAGTVLAPGMETLSVVFTPGDAVDYTTATASVPIVVGGLALSSFTPVGALIGSGDTTITLTGTGFVTTSMVMVNGAGVATAYVSPTMLTAVIPAALLKTTGALAVTVVDPAIGAATVAQTFSVVPPTGGATLSGPATTDPGSQPSVTLAITNPYPLALTAQFSLAFASAGTTVVDDPSIQFSSGGRTFSYTVAANSTSVPPVQLQAGTDAGTITITAKLMADGVDVTPAGLAPLVIVVPAVVPVISGTTMTASGSTLTVVMHGFSNTREVSSAVFDFTAATGDVLATPSVTIPGTTIFGTWYGDPASVAYGSTFTYTQVFNTSADAKTIGSVKVTVTNSVGTSLPSTSTGP